MKIHVILTAALAASITTAVAQKLPGAPEDNGLTPKSATIFVNSLSLVTDPPIINNANTESLGVAISSSGDIIVGWEDDAEDSEATPMQDLEAVWTMYDSAGTALTPDTKVTSVVAAALGAEPITNKFLGYFRADKSAVFGGAAWGPKIKANLFGEGVGMGASTFWLSAEVPEFAAWDDENMGDMPAVQLLDSQGKPVKILPGVSAAYATSSSSSIRIADWDYLSNGNIVIVGESRQGDDLVNLYGGETAANHAVFRILDAAGNVVKAETLASAEPVKSEMWHGAGVTKDGFALRFAGPGGATVRMFDNTGKPLSTNLDLAMLTGFPLAGAGGRGDSSGFHGNGKDAYVAVATGNSGTAENPTNSVWVTVINTNGTVRFSKSVADDLVLASVGAADAAIDADGSVIVVFQAKYNADNQSLVMGRRLSANGTPVGGTFYVSEKELPDGSAQEASSPRVAWRSGQVVIVWRSKNDGATFDLQGAPANVVAQRIFSTFAVGSIESVGLKRIVADTPVIKTTLPALGNWEPYSGVLGTTTFLVEGNTFADDGTDLNQRAVVALQPAAGGAMKLGEGFYADNGQPFKGQINLSRQNGNPGRVTGDTRPGAVNFMVGMEASPHAVAEFQSDNRWTLGFDRLSDGRYGTIQIFKLDTSTLVQTPLCKAQDSGFGRLTSGSAAGNQVSRYGGDLVCLDNGNFVSVVEDRSRAIVTDSDCVLATIFAPDGSIVKDSWVVANGDIWANVAPFKGGFAVRAKPADTTVASRLIYFYDNDGALKGTVDQATSGASFDAGRGDGTRIFGHINSPFVYLTGRPANTQIVKVAAFDSRTQTFVAITDVNEGAFTGNFDRAFGASDALDRLTVSWVSQPAGYAKQQVAARVMKFDGTAKTFTPLTKSFFPFVNNATNDIRTLQMSVAMTTKQICVAAKGEINYSNKPELGPDSPTEVNFYTVFTHPAPVEDPTTPVGGQASAKLSVAVSGSNVVISWDAAATGYTLESKSSLSDASWTTVGTANPSTVAIGTGSKFFRLRK